MVRVCFRFVVILLIAAVHQMCDAGQMGRVGAQIKPVGCSASLSRYWQQNSCITFPMRTFHSNTNKTDKADDSHSEEQKSTKQDFKKRFAVGAGIGLGVAAAWAYNTKEPKDSKRALIKHNFETLERIGQIYNKRAKQMAQDSLEANVYLAVYFTTQKNGAKGLAHMESVLNTIVAQEKSSALQSHPSAYLLGGQGNAQPLDIAARQKAIQLINETQLPVIIMQVTNLEYLEYPEFGQAFLKAFPLMQTLDVCKTIGQQAVHDIAVYETKGNAELLQQFRDAPTWQGYEQIKSLIPLHDVPAVP